MQCCRCPHIVGFSILLVATLMAGATAHVVAKYDPAALAKAIAEEGITDLFGVPATYQRLLEFKAVSGLAQLERGQLRRMLVAGAPLDLKLKARVEEEFGQSLFNNYGITECSPSLTGVRVNSPRSDESVGRFLPGIEHRLVDSKGAPVPNGEVGELHVRGPNVMLGYYRAPELTTKAINSEGWFNTGDLARLEGDHLFIVGRSKELIIRSGFNVYPAEVEAVLNAHELVVQSAVIGRAVSGNEEVVAFVQLLPGATIDAAGLMRTCRWAAHILQAPLRDRDTRRAAGGIHRKNSEAQIVGERTGSKGARRRVAADAGSRQRSVGGPGAAESVCFFSAGR